MFALLGCVLAFASVPSTSSSETTASASARLDAASQGPRITETRTYKIRQTVSLNDVPATAKEVRLWVPVPADGPWQHVLDRRVVEAPAGWSLVHQPACD